MEKCNEKDLLLILQHMAKDINSLSYDKDGQVILYSKIYKWNDGSFRNVMEDKCKCKEDTTSCEIHFNGAEFN